MMKNGIPYLKKGDLIYITSPAKSIEKEHVIFSKKYLESRGFRVKISPHCTEQNNYFSGTDLERRSDFQTGIDDTEVKAILCARGGYGSVRIIDDLQWAAFLRNPKWIIGFSDITYFHNKINGFELPSIHATMSLNFSTNTKEALNTLIYALTGKLDGYKIKSSGYNKLGKAEGIIIGGNLSILYALLGTNNDLDYRNKILFIEDLAENLYAIDRMLYSFQKAGVFDKIKGLIVGGMTDLKDTAKPFGKTYQEIILEKFIYNRIPICFDFPAGHIDNNKAITFGKPVNLVVEKDYTTLEF
jgi:muramoyltetrapeptide carboxypeptidase